MAMVTVNIFPMHLSDWMKAHLLSDRLGVGAEHAVSAVLGGYK